MAERLLVGVVVGAQSLGGLLRVKSFTHNPADLAAYGPVDVEAADGTGTRRIALKVTGTAKGVVIVRAAGITDRTQAEALKGARFFVARTALPDADEDEFYQSDLVGLAAEREDSTALGVVKGVYDFGAGELIEIEGPGGSQMLPFTRAVVPVVDLAGKRVVVVPPVMVGSEAEDRGDDDGDETADEREAVHDASA